MSIVTTNVVELDTVILKDGIEKERIISHCYNERTWNELLVYSRLPLWT